MSAVCDPVLRYRIRTAPLFFFYMQNNQYPCFFLLATLRVVGSNVRSTSHYRTVLHLPEDALRPYGLFSSFGKCLPHLFIVREYSGFNTSLPSAPGTLLHPVLVFSLSCLCFKTPTQIASDTLHIDSMDDALRTGISFYL